MRRYFKITLIFSVFLVLSCKTRITTLKLSDTTFSKDDEIRFKHAGKVGYNILYMAFVNKDKTPKCVVNGKVISIGKTQGRFNNIFFKPEDIVEFYLNNKLIVKLDSTNTYRYIRIQSLKRNGYLKKRKNNYLVLYHNSFQRHEMFFPLHKK